MHGAFKVPGGKLVVVDFDVVYAAQSSVTDATLVVLVTDKFGTDAWLQRVP